MLDETTEARVERLVLEYAQNLPEGRPLHPGLSLQNDLAIESLSLVSLALRLGGEFGVDVVDLDLELRDLRTLGDLMKVARTLCFQTDHSIRGEGMKSQDKPKEAEDASKSPAEDSKDNGSGEGEFKLTVRKLKVPVRPRGVLAE
jgi:acyl carrier protein